MNNNLKQHLFNSNTWLRGFFMLLYVLIYCVVKVVVGAVVLFQFGTLLVTGDLNPRLLAFGQTLSLYTYQIMQYITYNNDYKPFPLNPWPKETDNP
jgi:hypothetical protein